ncbi:MAG TPA: nuclear transport factor 2 family protein [Alphaproteobacteria bacterium]|nr:nuclear transport factor 2 family protein [Alphaproteobacteria bacterium]
MKFFAIAATLLLVLVSNAQAAVSAADKAAITELEYGLARTMNVDDLPKYYAPDIVLYDMLGNFKDMDAVRKNFVNFFQSVQSFTNDFVNLAIDSDGKLAFAYSVQKDRFTLKNGQAVETTFRETDCLEKKNGKWLIVHSQLSVPVDFATGKAIMNGPL